jgi:hypothetical protein
MSLPAMYEIKSSFMGRDAYFKKIKDEKLKPQYFLDDGEYKKMDDLEFITDHEIGEKIHDSSVPSWATLGHE